MMMRIRCAALAVVCGLAVVPASAQSLADVARQEEARRKNPTAKKAVKSFSNADLAPNEIAPPPAAPPATDAPAGCVESASQGKCVPTEEVVAKSQDTATQADPQVKTSEATIRERATRIRERLLKAQQDLEPVRNTANDRSRSPGERAAATRMVEQGEKMIEGIEKQWRALEKQVASEELPREWLAPIPLLSTRTP